VSSKPNQQLEAFDVALTFFGDHPSALEVAFICDEQQRLVERFVGASRLLTDADDDVASLLKRTPVGDGVDDNVAVDAELAPQVGLLQIDKACQRISRRCIKSAQRRTSNSVRWSDSTTTISSRTVVPIILLY